MATLTVYPGSIGTDNPVDGFIYATGVDDSWSTLIGLSSGNTVNISANYIGFYVASTTTTNNFTDLYRSILCFDTSSIPANAVISSVTLSLYRFYASQGLGDTSLHIVGATPANTNNLVNGDYSQLGSTSFANVASFMGMSAVAYTDFSLNANGIANINKGGITSFGLKSGWDINSNFSGTWVAANSSQILVYSSNNGSNMPKLVIEYTVPAQAGFLFNMV